MRVLKPGDRILVSTSFKRANCRSPGHQDILALMYFNNYLSRDIASAEQSARKGKSIKFGNSMPTQAISSSWLSWRICKLMGHLIPSSMVSPFINVSDSRRRWDLSCCESLSFQASRQRKRFTSPGDKRDDKYPEFCTEGTVRQAHRNYFNDGNHITYRKRSMAWKSL